MPYLEYLYCEHCGDHFPLDIDYLSTIAAYRKDGRPSTNITQATLIWDYLIYSCSVCKQTYKYTFRDVEQRVREYLSSLSIKYEKYFEELTKYQGDEEARRAGTFFTGMDSEVKERISKIYHSRGSQE